MCDCRDGGGGVDVYLFNRVRDGALEGKGIFVVPVFLVT